MIDDMTDIYIDTCGTAEAVVAWRCGKDKTQNAFSVRPGMGL